MTRQTFLRGTAILMIAGFITKFLGFINRIVIARLIGAEGVGLYVMATPTLLLMITLTQLGLPVAISKLVAEADAEQNERKIKQILVVSLSITGLLSSIFTVAMIYLAPFIANTLLTDQRALYPLLAMIPVIPIIACSSVIRGYFQGLHNMKPTAVSQVIEQIVRISLVAMFTHYFLPYGIEVAAAFAMGSAVIGEFASLIYMITLFKKGKPFRMRKQFFAYVKSGQGTFFQLLKIALPTTGSRLIGSISLFFEPIVVMQSLAIAGVAAVAATKQYGELAGFVIPVLMLPTFITYSLSVSLIPTVSEALARKKFDLIHYRLNQAIRVGLLSGGIAVIVLYTFAEPIMLLMYNNVQAAIFVKLIAPFCLFLYLQGPLQATLQALHLAKTAMMNSLFSAMIKIVLIFVLATRPELGINGVALALIIHFVLVTLLHFSSIVKAISFTIDMKLVMKFLTLMIMTAFFSEMISTVTFSAHSLLIQTLMAIGITTLFYSILALLFRLVTIDEYKRIRFTKK